MAPKHLNRRRHLLFGAAAVLVLLPSGSSATAVEYCSKRASRTKSVPESSDDFVVFLQKRGGTTQ